jgi:hypothetical protein
MNCRNCGGPLNENEKFCKHCGSKNEQKSQQRSTYYNKEITFDQISGSSNDSFVYGRKSRILAAILALLTSFGIYNFYLGYKKKAIFQLVITLIGITFSIAMSLVLQAYGEVVLYYLLAIGNIIATLTVGIWGLVDAIRLFTRNINVDGYGNPLL